MVPIHRVTVCVLLIISVVRFIFRFKREYVIRSKGTAIPTLQYNTTPATRRRYVSIVLVVFENWQFSELSIIA